MLRPFERKSVYYVAHHLVAEPGFAKKRRALPVEKPAVVRRQSYGRVAFVYSPAEIVDGRPVPRRFFGEDIVSVLAPPDVAAHLVPKGVVVVAVVAYGEKVSVFRVEDEQKAVKIDQGGFAHPFQRRVGSRAGDGARKFRKNFAENQFRKIARDALLVEPAFIDRTLVERAGVGGSGKEGFLPENEHEHREPVAAAGFGQDGRVAVLVRQTQNPAQVNFEKLLRNGPGALEVKPPLRAVGKNAPSEFSLGQVVRPAKITQHLGRRRRHLVQTLGAPVEGAAPALGLDYGETEPVTLPLFGKAVGAVLGRIVRKQQAVGHVFHAVGRQVLPAKARSPSEQSEYGPDQVFLGIRLVGFSLGRKPVENLPKRPVENIHGLRVESLPVRQLGYGLA